MELADVVARIESNDNQFAQRFERHHLGASGDALLTAIVRAHGGRISRATADVYAAMSHGAFQIMGFRLWGDPARGAGNLGYKGALWNYLNSPAEQRATFALYCAQSKIAFTLDEMADPVKLALFARRYNGPGNVVEYSRRVAAAIKAMRDAT